MIEPFTLQQEEILYRATRAGERVQAIASSVLNYDEKYTILFFLRLSLIKAFSHSNMQRMQQKALK